MGRIGVSLQDVAKAAHQLQGRGKNPTVDNIREILGTGSKSTIIQHLKAWKSQQGEAQGQLPANLQAMVTGLWEQLNTQAEERIKVIEEKYAKEIQVKEDRLTAIQNENNTLKINESNLQENLAVEIKIKEKTLQDLAQQKHENAKLNEKFSIALQQIDNQMEENKRLHQLASSMQANLEHYQHAIQQARIEQQQQIEKIQFESQQELNGARHALMQINEKLQNKELALQDAKLEASHSKSLYESLRKEHEIRNDELQNAMNELISAKERYEQTKENFKEQQNEMKAMRTLILDLEKQNAIYKDQVPRLEKHISSLEDKVEILRDEKVFLLQENAEYKRSFEALQNVKTKRTA